MRLADTKKMLTTNPPSTCSKCFHDVVETAVSILVVESMSHKEILLCFECFESTYGVFEKVNAFLKEKQRGRAGSITESRCCDLCSCYPMSKCNIFFYSTTKSSAVHKLFFCEKCEHILKG